MSRTERVSEVEVSRPAFPFFPPSHPQLCRFSIPERFPFLQPFRQDRLARLPFVMASSSDSISKSPVGSIQRKDGEIDPQLKVLQLEKNLSFVQESHASMLKALHQEIADLKKKNRELLFELVTGITALPKDSSEENDEDILDEDKEKIEKLEKEVKKLRGALKDALKANSNLSNQMLDIKREPSSKQSSRSKNHIETPQESIQEDGRPVCGPSPQMEEYSDTLRQIQRASYHRKHHHHDERRQGNGDRKSEWFESYGRSSGSGYHHNHHRNNHQKSNHHHDQQRLPRLPLRNQQNFPQQYEIQYRQRNASSSILPALVPVMDHKPRKPRGQPKLADQVN